MRHKATYVEATTRFELGRPQLSKNPPRDYLNTRNLHLEHADFYSPDSW